MESWVFTWDVATRRPVNLEGPSDRVIGAAVAYSPDGRSLAVVSGVQDCAGRDIDARCVRTAMQLWDRHSLHRLRTVTLADVTPGQDWAGIRTLTFTPDGRYLASTDQTSGTRIWDPATGRTIRTVSHSRVACLAYAPNGAAFATGSLDGTVKIWAS